jgi:hypothetical protein
LPLDIAPEVTGDPVAVETTRRTALVRGSWSTTIDRRARQLVYPLGLKL